MDAAARVLAAPRGSAGTSAAGTTGAAGNAGTTDAAGSAGTTGAAEGARERPTPPRAARNDRRGSGGGATGSCGDSTSSNSGDTCNVVVAAGPCVVPQSSTGTPPTPAGGTIVAGTYNLTSETVYGVADGGNNQQGGHRQTLMASAVVAGSFTLDQVEESGTTIARSHGTVVATGTMVTFTPTCPPPGDGGDQGGSANYTATATTFDLIQTQNGTIDVQVYTKM